MGAIIELAIVLVLLAAFAFFMKKYVLTNDKNNKKK